MNIARAQLVILLLKVSSKEAFAPSSLGRSISTMSASTSWISTTLRIKDPKKSLPFYVENFGMKVAETIDSDGESRYFLVRPRDQDLDSFAEQSGSSVAHEKLYIKSCNYIELLHKHGVEEDSELHYDSGNNEPMRGFGHLAFSVADVYASCARLESAGVQFKKKPDEGRMKGLAFVFDPDGYWIEIVKRSNNANFPEEYNLSQTMMRVKDPAKSLAFYTGHLGMSLLCSRHFSDFSLFFLMSVPKDSVALPNDEASRNEYMKCNWHPILELTHNHGTEKDPEFKHHTGNSDPLGFCSIGFTTDNLEEVSEKLRHDGVKFAEPELATKVSPAFEKAAVVLDPDGYAVKIIAKGTAL